MSSENYYHSINEMSLYNWKECQSGDLRFVRLDVTNGNEIDDSKCWDEVYNSFIQKFGLSKKLNEYLRQKNNLTKKYKEFAISGDRFVLNEINTIKERISDLEKQTGGGSIDDAVFYVSKSFGNFINEKKVTVVQFYTAYNKLVEDGKKN